MLWLFYVKINNKYIQVVMQLTQDMSFLYKQTKINFKHQKK